MPLAALAGILLFVAWNMGEWHEFARLQRFSVPYRVTLLGTFTLTVFDLMVAVEVGLLLACGFFIWRMSQLFRAEPAANLHAPAGMHVVRLYGSLFFGAVRKLEGLADRLPADTRVVVLDTERLISIDNSGLDALAQLHRALQRRGVRLVLCGLNEQPLQMIRRSGFDAALGATNLRPGGGAA